MNDQKKLILVVDDEGPIREVFKLILEQQGYNVDTAETGREALEKSAVRVHNLALLDIRLPDMEGTELLGKLHNQRPKMMKIMVTGYPSIENAVESLNVGADAYVIKPVRPEKLLRVVEEKLREQEEMESMSQEKIDEWIMARIQKLEQKYENH